MGRRATTTTTIPTTSPEVARDLDRVRTASDPTDRSTRAFQIPSTRGPENSREVCSGRNRCSAANPRPPVFGGKSPPVFGGGLGPGPGPGAGAGAASNPIVGFGVGSGIGNIGVGSAGGYAGAAGGGVPLAFGGNSPGESRGSPSPLGASPLSGGGAFPGSIGSVGGSGSGGKEGARSSAEQTGRARGTPPRYPKRSAR